MSRLRLSLLVTFFSSNGSTAVFFLVSLVLARVLTPREIGIFSMTSVLVGIAHVFRDFGVSSYLLQEKDLTPQKIRSASGVLITASWILGAGMFVASGTIADYLKQPATKDVMQVLAAGFFFIPFGAITHALLTREYRANEQALVYIAGTSAYTISAIWMAYSGFSYMSMAWANLINIMATCAAYTLFRPKNAPWMPAFSGWGRVANFGAGAFFGGALGQINNALPDIWLGKASGAHDVGLFSRASGTAGIFMQIAGPTVNYAAVPHMAQQHHQGESLEQTLCKATAYLSVCAWPPLVITAIYSREVVQFLYGAQWLDCVPLVQLLCISSCIGIASHLHGAALQAMGRPFLAIAPQAASLIARVTCIILIYDGTLISFGRGLVVASVLTIPVNLLVQEKFLDVGNRAFASALMPSIAVTLACGSAGVILHIATPAGWPALASLILLAVILGPVWLVALATARHPFFKEIETVGARFHLVAKVLQFVARLRSNNSDT